MFGRGKLKGTRDCVFVVKGVGRNKFAFSTYLILLSNHYVSYVCLLGLST